MTIYPASNLKHRCIEYDPITIKFLESIGIKLNNEIKQYRGGSIERPK